jgi:acetyl-CoA carboxylase biotin carboxyl carrier protein
VKRLEIRSDVAGKVWKIEAPPGTRVAQDQAIVVIESMKMEIPLGAPRAGTVVELRVREGDAVGEGDLIAVLEQPA